MLFYCNCVILVPEIITFLLGLLLNYTVCYAIGYLTFDINFIMWFSYVSFDVSMFLRNR